MENWLLSGTVDNWERAIADSTWGVTEKRKGSWEQIAKGDQLFFYATLPAKGIVGIGEVTSKFKQDKPLWKEEIEENKVKWPYRFEFHALYVLSRPDWESRSIKLGDLPITLKRARAGIIHLRRSGDVAAILERANSSWGLSLGEKPKKPPTVHEQMIEQLLEIGGFDDFIAEKEYLLPDIKERLDVVWRRVPASVPTFAFEVHIGGNLDQALTKLKHAYDLWNSNPYLILEQEDRDKAQTLLTGAFHQIRDKVKILTTQEVVELHDSQKKDDQLKRKHGLR